MHQFVNQNVTLVLIGQHSNQLQLSLTGFAERPPCQYLIFLARPTEQLYTSHRPGVCQGGDRQYVTVHGKTHVNDLSLKRKNRRTTNEQRTNATNVSTNYQNVPSMWNKKYERVKAKIHTIF